MFPSLKNFTTGARFQCLLDDLLREPPAVRARQCLEAEEEEPLINFLCTPQIPHLDYCTRQLFVEKAKAFRSIRQCLSVCPIRRKLLTLATNFGFSSLYGHSYAQLVGPTIAQSSAHPLQASQRIRKTFLKLDQYNGHILDKSWPVWHFHDRATDAVFIESRKSFFLYLLFS